MPQLNPVWFASQLFWLAISFVLLYVVLSRFILPPIQDMLARRLQTRETDLEQAQSFKSQAESARQNYEKTLAEARARTQQLMSESEAEQKAAAEAATRELDKQIAAKLSDAQQKIAAQKDKLIADLTPTAATLASDIVAKLTSHTPANDVVNKALGSISKRNG